MKPQNLIYIETQVLIRKRISGVKLVWA